MTRQAALRASIHRLSHRLERAEKRKRRTQDLRLLAGAIFCLGLLASAVRPSLNLALPMTVFFIPIFFILVLRTRSFATHVLNLSEWRNFLIRCLARAHGDPKALRADKRSKDDLGLNGPESLWTNLNETFTENGEDLLYSWFHPDVNTLTSVDLENRQNQIKKYRSRFWFFLKMKLNIVDSQSLISTRRLQEALLKPVYDKGFKYFALTGIFFWFLAVFLSFQPILGHPSMIGAPFWAFVIFVAFNFYSVRFSKNGFSHGTGISLHLDALSPILKVIEKRVRSDIVIRELAPAIADQTPSGFVKRLDLALGIVGVEVNPLLFFILNLLCPWSVAGLFWLERERNRLAQVFPKHAAELAQMEALGSLVFFDRFQTQTYPSLDSKILCFTDVFHPLLPREKSVPNSFSFDSLTSVALMTGSNMSGKSTFLRTAGINQTLANMGAPVFALEMKTQPMKVETCIEVSDSLRDGFSYFYAEVRRIKAVLDEAHSSLPTLFLIDEIFRGTNNRERHIGSRAVIKSLAQSPTAQGFVSTHDLELTTIDRQASRVTNIHFREDIVGQEMVFTYKLKHGPSPTTNALRIMRSAGLPIEEGDLLDEKHAKA
jgi:hypothetical protein